MNNSGNKININTKLYTSYSDACLLTLGGWNANISLKIAPFKGVDANGFRQYAQDSTETIITSLTVENTTALLEGIKNCILPAIESGDISMKSVSVPIGEGTNKKILSIKSEGNDTFLKLIVGVAENGVAQTNNSIEHKFNKKEYIKDYDPVSGGGEVVVVHADLLNFVKKLEDVYKFSGATVHANKYNEALKASFGTNRSAYNQPATNSYSAPTTNIPNGDMSSFLPFN